jgi:hypothetical protein
MLQPKPRPENTRPEVAKPATPAASGRGRKGPVLFGLLDSLLVDGDDDFDFAGTVKADEVEAVWLWLSRDAAPDLVAVIANSADPAAEFERSLSALLAAANAELAAAGIDPEVDRRLRIKLGSPEIRERLPVVLDALKCVPLIEKARTFGRAINAMQDSEAVTSALKTMTRHDSDLAAMLMVATVAEVAQPARLVIAAARSAAASSEEGLMRAGFAPVIEAVLAHAYKALGPMRQPAGTFADVDLVCRSVERFHRNIRAVRANIGFDRRGKWGPMMATMTRIASGLLEPRLREVISDINGALRRPREGGDRIEQDSVLSALNGLYLLAAVRGARDSLALNELCEETWNRSGQALEMNMERAMDALREAPADKVALARVNAGIKMSEVRFGPEYGRILAEARDKIVRKV